MMDVDDVTEESAELINVREFLAKRVELIREDYFKRDKDVFASICSHMEWTDMEEAKRVAETCE